MSTVTPVTSNRMQPASKSAIPPEEQFWQRYSPHHEFPLSSVASVTLHILAFVLLALVAWWIAKLASDKERPLQEIGVLIQGGGGGNPKGEGDGAGGPLAAQPEEDPGKAPKEDVNPVVDPKPNVLEKPTNVPPPAAINETDDATRRLIESGNAAAVAQQRISRETNNKLRKSITGKGEGGPGRDGGKDRGTDTGKGRQKGAGQDIDARVKRTLRWVMVFNTYNGDDYARQLAGLGAILAIPQQGKGDKYMVLRDLNARPARGRIEDIEQIKRIYWVDDKRESITPLCMALGIKPVPDHVVAFFPEKLENKLLEIELQYKGLKEDEIFETKFSIRKSGGSYEPVVIEQKPN